MPRQWGRTRYYDLAQDVMVIGRHVTKRECYDIDTRAAGVRLWRGGKQNNASHFTIKDVVRVILAIFKRHYRKERVDWRAFMAADRIFTFLIYHHPVKLPWHAFPVRGWGKLPLYDPYSNHSKPYEGSNDDNIPMGTDEDVQQWLDS